MLHIKIHTIPHATQRYNTVGDYWINPNDNTFHIRVSDCENWKMEFLVAIHEAIEQALCLDRGIKEEFITKFDIDNIDSEEPGAMPNAPYHKEHMFATEIERQLAIELDVDWNEYEKKLSSL